MPILTVRKLECYLPPPYVVSALLLMAQTSDKGMRLVIDDNQHFLFKIKSLAGTDYSGNQVKSEPYFLILPVKIKLQLL